MAAKRYNYRNENPVTFTRGGLTIGVPPVEELTFQPALAQNHRTGKILTKQAIKDLPLANYRATPGSTT